MDYDKAAAYWREKESADVLAPEDVLMAEAEKFILAHNTCALATGSGDFIRCTPIEYSYRQGAFWMMSEGGLKFRALEGNLNVCLAIFDPYEGFSRLGGMQVSGTAKLIEPWSPEYLDFLAYKKLPEKALRGLNHPMYLICVNPSEIEFLSSAFKAMGYASRQRILYKGENS